MARPLRLEFSGALYHITSRGNDRKPIYFEESDFESFLLLLGQVCEQFNWVIHAYCLMTNHYHLLVETPDANLAKGMRQINGLYTQFVNRKYRRVGHLFQGRYKAILVDKEAYLLELSRYIVLNPIRANIVTKLDDWPWSSWHSAMGRCVTQNWLATDALLGLFAKNRKTAVAKYADFVQQGQGVELWGKLTNQIFLGSDEFVKTHLAMIQEPETELSEIPKKQRRATPLTIAEYERNYATRDEAIKVAYQSGAYTLEALGNYFGLHYSRVSRIVAKGNL